jgi:hypothetical protein
MALIRLNNQSISSVTALPSGITSLPSSITSASGLNENLEGMYRFGTSYYAKTQSSTSGTSYVFHGNAVSITPKSTSSQILVYFSTHCATPTNNTNIFMRVGYRIGAQPDASNISFEPSDLDTEGSMYSSATGLENHVSFSWFHSPNTTSTVYYKLQYKSENSNTVYMGSTARMTRLWCAEVI